MTKVICYLGQVIFSDEKAVIKRRREQKTTKKVHHNVDWNNL